MLYLHTLTYTVLLMAIDTRLLINQIAENNSQQAFEKLYHAYFRKCYSFAFYFTKSTHLAEEVISDVFLSLWQNRELLLAIEDFASYLYISVRNQALLYLKQAEKRNQISIETFILDVFREEENPESRLLEKELTNIASQAINSLPEKCRIIYLMVKEEKMSYKQVADILQLSERTVNSQMTIAVKKLGLAINNYLEDTNYNSAKKRRNI